MLQGSVLQETSRPACAEEREKLGTAVIVENVVVAPASRRNKVTKGLGDARARRTCNNGCVYKLRPTSGATQTGYKGSGGVPSLPPRDHRPPPR